MEQPERSWGLLPKDNTHGVGSLTPILFMIETPLIIIMSSLLCNWLYMGQLQKTLCLAIREVIFLVKGLLRSPIMKGYVIHIHKLPPIWINSFQKAHIHYKTVILMLLYDTTMFLSFSSCHNISFMIISLYMLRDERSTVHWWYTYPTYTFIYYIWMSYNVCCV